MSPDLRVGIEKTLYTLGAVLLTACSPQPPESPKILDSQGIDVRVPTAPPPAAQSGEPEPPSVEKLQIEECQPTDVSGPIGSETTPFTRFRVSKEMRLRSNPALAAPEINIVAAGASVEISCMRLQNQEGRIFVVSLFQKPNSQQILGWSEPGEPRIEELMLRAVRAKTPEKVEVTLPGLLETYVGKVDNGDSMLLARLPAGDGTPQGGLLTIRFTEEMRRTGRADEGFMVLGFVHLGFSIDNITNPDVLTGLIENRPFQLTRVKGTSAEETLIYNYVDLFRTNGVPFAGERARQRIEALCGCSLSSSK